MSRRDRHEEARRMGLTGANREQDNARAATHLRRLGLNPVTIQRLTSYAEEEAMSLRELVAYVLRDYVPASDAREEDR